MDILWPLGRLYLDENIYVDYQVPLTPHQRDGIRFLYRQFKKAQPGVILNDPTGYGKCLQAVSFLNAIRSLLSKPILILCEASALDNWKEHFEKYTDFSCSDVAPETANLYENYSVFIKPITEALSFSRRNWSVVVVHDSVFTKDRFQTIFKADFKIWVTSFNMKENLHIFASIYEWIHPNCNFNVGDIEATADAIEKSLLIDAYLDDLVIRRSGFSTPFQVKRKIIKQEDEESPIKVSRKNKDPTGKKVKRSKKRRIEDDEIPNDDVSCNNSNTLETENESKKINGNHAKSKVNDANTLDSNIEFCFLETNNGKTNDKKMDVESFIRNEDVIESNVTELSDVDTTSQQSVNLFSESKSTLKFKDFIDDIVEKKNEIETQEEDSLHLIYEINGQDSINAEDYIIVKTTADVEEARLRNEEDFGNKNNKNIELQNEIVLIDSDDSEPKTDLKTKSDDIINDIEIPESSTNEAKVTRKQVLEENIENNGKVLSEKESGIDITEGINKKTNIEIKKKNKGPTNNIDDVLAKFEQDALQKFKGSFLDRLF